MARGPDVTPSPELLPDRRFEAFVIAWEGTTVPDGDPGAQPPAALPGLVEQLSAGGAHVVVVGEAGAGSIVDRLGARPAGPGTLHVCSDRGTIVHRVDGHRLTPVLERSDPSGPGRGRATTMPWVFEQLCRRGVGPGLVLVAGDGLVPPGSERATVLAAGEPGSQPDRLVQVLTDQVERRRLLRVPDVDDDPRWCVRLEDRPELRRVHAALTALANGRVGSRGRYDDGGSEPLLVAANVYGDRQQRSLLPGPRWSSLIVRNSSTRSECTTLDLHAGVEAWQRDHLDGPATRALRFVSATEPAACAFRAEGATSRLAPGEPLSAPGGAPYDDGRTSDGLAWARTTSPGGPGITVAARGCQASANGRRTLERLAAVVITDDPEPAAAELRRLAAAGYDALLADHRRAWARRWEVAAISIDGDPEAELGARFSLFHLLASAVAAGESAVGPRGLTGHAYGGHVFWDADVFMLPALAATVPEAARAMLEYRIRRLPAARAIATGLGRAGARFPWESGADGQEVTPTLARLPDGSVVPIRTGLREDHISADVAWAASEYATWTGDQAFLRGAGRPLLTETARFWASRTRLDRRGRAHICGVIGPDEYHEVVDDNAYTNVMARWNLRRAAMLVRADSPTGDELAEAARWEDLAARLVDGYDAMTGRYEQFAGFDDLEPLIITDVADPPVAADLLLGRRRVLGSQILKQPDVLMLHHLVPDEVAPGSLVPNLDHYGPRTAHGSSLSPAVYAALLARAGRPDEARHWFHLAARLDLDDITGTTAAGLHLATMGGVWQALAYGFAGLRAGPEGVVIDPRLPRAWRSLEIGFRFWGRRVRVTAGHDAVQVDADSPVPVRVGSSPARVVDHATIPLVAETAGPVKEAS